jgi:hypothetical protein
MTNSTRYLTVMFLVSILLFSCTKDEPMPSADISILSPAPLSEYNIYDTIAVSLTVQTSAEAGVSVSLQLMNENFIPVQPARTLENITVNTEQVILYPIIDSTLADGVFNLRIQAFGDIETTQAYRQIYINEIPRTLKSIWLVADQSEGIELMVLDETYELIENIQTESDYSGSAMSSVNGQFYLAGKNSGNLTAYNGYTQNQAWFIPAVPNPNQPYFTCVRAFDEVCYTGFWQGQVIGYNKYGGVVTATEFNENTIPENIFVHDVFLIKSAQRRSNADQKVIETYFVQSGARISETNLNFAPVGYTAPEFRKILIFGNKEEKAVTHLFDPTSGMISNPYEPFALPTEKIIATTEISESKTVFSTENGVYIYEYLTSLTQINNLQQATALAYNPLNQTILAVAGTEVIVMNLQGSIFYQYDAQKPLRAIHLFFNK